MQVSGNCTRLNEAEKLRHAISSSQPLGARQGQYGLLSATVHGPKAASASNGQSGLLDGNALEYTQTDQISARTCSPKFVIAIIANIHPHPFGEPALRNLSRLTPLPERERPRPEDIRQSLINSRLFDPGTIFELHEDLRGPERTPGNIFEIRIWGGWRFTTPEIVAQALAHFHRETHAALEAALILKPTR